MKWYKGDTGNFDRTRWDEPLDLYPLKKFTKYTRIRIVGDPIKVHTHWIKFYSTFKEGLTQAGLVCPRMDPDLGEFRKNVECCGCDVAFTAPEGKKAQELKKKRFRTDISYYTKIIIRPFQKVNKKYVRNTRIPTSVYNAVSELSDLAFTAIKEKYGSKIATKFEKVFDPAHPKLGFDFMVKFNTNAKTPANAYSVQFVGITPLTAKERKAIGNPNIPGKIVKAASNENIRQLLTKANLIGLIEGKSSKQDDRVDDKDKDTDDEGDYTYEDIMEMDKDDLIEIISDMELSIKKPKLLPLKKLRNRVAEEMELDEEDTDEEDEESLSSYIDKLDDMDKTELLVFIKKNNLDIPKPKAKTAPKLRKLIEIELSSMDEESGSEDEDEDDDFDDDDFFEKKGSGEEEDEDKEYDPDDDVPF